MTAVEGEASIISCIARDGGIFTAADATAIGGERRA
jgi:hypothetical protein